MSLYGKVFLPTVMAATSLVQAQSVCDIQLQCRANFTGAFNLPDAAFFTNNTPSINDAGDVAIYISTIAGTDAKMVWYGGDGAGQIVYTSPDGASLSDVSLNNSGFIAFPQSFASPTGVIGVDGPTSVASTLVLPGAPFGATSFSSVRLDDLGRVGFRASIASIGNAYITSDNGSQRNTRLRLVSTLQARTHFSLHPR